MWSSHVVALTASSRPAIRLLVVGAVYRCCLSIITWLDVVFFFFQAEDGIRDLIVTGVQTCALPISRNLEDEFGARVELSDNGKIAVIARGRLGREATRDFGLDDDVYFVDEVDKSEKVMKDRRSDVVRKIAVDP